MFPSRKRELIISQREHLRLVAQLALFWGNSQFDRPVLPWEPFRRGVAFHDWHYPELDTLAIIGAPEADWLAITKDGMAAEWGDPVTDIIIKLHLQRLLAINPSEERRALMAQLEAEIQALLPATGFSRADFTWADQITRLCDNISFFFCFEEPRQRTYAVGSRVGGDEMIDVTLEVTGDGRVIVSPWPFNVPYIAGTLIGYDAAGYPDTLVPRLVPYHICG